MEISELRKRVRETIDRARRSLAARRARTDEANAEFPVFLERIAIPLFRQTAGVLKAEGLPYTVFTPGNSVRLVSDHNPQDFIEMILDTSGDVPVVTGRTSRARGRRILESERPVADGPVRTLAEDDVVAFLTQALEPYVER
jgi:hypothetical protein